MGATASIAALALTGYQTVSSVRGIANQADAQTRALNTNAALADKQGAEAIAQGDYAANQVGRETSQLIGAQKVAGAGQGVDISSGSMADLQAESAGIGALDALMIKHNARAQAFGYQVDAANSRTEADYVKQSARRATTSTLLTGAASLYGQYRDGQESGLYSRKKAGQSSYSVAGIRNAGRRY